MDSAGIAAAMPITRISSSISSMLPRGLGAASIDDTQASRRRLHT
jgi:hypothetical protein